MSDTCQEVTTLKIGDTLHIRQVVENIDGSTPLPVVSSATGYGWKGEQPSVDLAPTVSGNEVQVDYDTSTLSEGVWFFQTTAILNTGEETSSQEIRIVMQSRIPAPA